MKIKIEGTEIKFGINDFMYEISRELSEDDQIDMMNSLSWFDSILKKAVDLLAEEYSRPNYNESIHKFREDLLVKLKQEEIKYYASKIATLLEENRRWQNLYWKMYHHHMEVTRHLDQKCHKGFELPKHEPIDFDGRAEAGKVIEEFLNKQKEKK